MGVRLDIDGTEYEVPEDLDLNEVVELKKSKYDIFEEEVIHMVWMIVRRDNPDVTMQEAGSKLKFKSLISKDDKEEGPPPIPLSEPEAQSGTSSDESNGNGSTGVSAVTAIHGATGLQ